MAQRIKKSEWNDFARRFSARNQFRLLELTGTAVSKGVRQTPLLYLLGIRYVAGPPEEAVEVYVARTQDPYVGYRALSVGSPKVCTLVQDRKGVDSKLTITEAGEKKAGLVLHGDLSTDIRRDVTAKVAYALFERSGHNHGRDFEHWGEAERVVLDLERMVTEGFIK